MAMTWATSPLRGPSAQGQFGFCHSTLTVAQPALARSVRASTPPNRLVVRDQVAFMATASCHSGSGRRAAQPRWETLAPGTPAGRCRAARKPAVVRTGRGAVRSQADRSLRPALAAPKPGLVVTAL